MEFLVNIVSVCPGRWWNDAYAFLRANATWVAERGVWVYEGDTGCIPGKCHWHGDFITEGGIRWMRGERRQNLLDDLDLCLRNPSHLINNSSPLSAEHVFEHRQRVMHRIADEQEYDRERSE